VLAIDTNILLPAVVASSHEHDDANAFMASVRDRDDVAVSELVLLELYVLLRNPAVLKTPLGARAAVDVCSAFRRHPRWQVIGFPVESKAFHDAFWPRLATKDFARRRAYDWRLALTLREHGVDELATANTKDFTGFGFRRVWNPLSS
jgi:toxin-antitoxin system PIN domain toxin